MPELPEVEVTRRGVAPHIEGQRVDYRLPLIAEHAPLIAAAGAEDLVVREGFRFGFRTARAFDDAARRARALESSFGVRHRVEDGAALAKAEPALRQTLAGAVHWLDPWAVRNPGALVQRYAALFVARGGQVLTGDATTLQRAGAAWAASRAWIFGSKRL